jgi:phosphate-selective porin OprO/OprP
MVSKRSNCRIVPCTPDRVADPHCSTASYRNYSFGYFAMSFRWSFPSLCRVPKRSQGVFSAGLAVVAFVLGVDQCHAQEFVAEAAPYTAAAAEYAPLPSTDDELGTSPLPATDLETRVRELEAIVEQQAQRNQRLEAQRAYETATTNNTHYFVPDEAASSLESRIAEIEEARRKEAAAAAKKAAADEKAKSASAERPTMKWNGRIHADYWAFPHTSPGANAFETGDVADSVDDRFLFRRLRLAVSGKIPDNMTYALQVEFNNPSSPQIKDAFLGWEELPWLQTVLVGNQKRPYGLDHLNSSNVNVFLERPAIIDAFNQDSRRFGVQSLNVSDDEVWNWQYGTFLQQDLQNVGTVFTTPDAEDYQAEVAGRLANTLWYDEASDGRGYAHWAIAGTVASPDGYAGSASTARFQTRPEARTSNRWLDTGTIVGADTYELGGLEGVLNLGALQVVGEYQQVWMQRDVAADLSFHGGYVYASYFLTGEHSPWDRASGTLDRPKPFENFWLVRTCNDDVAGGWGAWQVAARYSHANLSNQNVLGGVEDEMTLSLVWWWNQHARMQFNYIYGEIDEHAPVDGQTFANYHILGTRFNVDF